MRFILSDENILLAPSLQNGGRMSALVTAVPLSEEDNATYLSAPTAVTTADILTTPLFLNATNSTVPHKCLVLLYEDIGTSR